MARRANIQKKLIPLELYALSWVTKWWGRYNFPRRKIRKKYLDKIPLFRKAVLEGAASRREETEREIVRNDYSAVHAAMKWLRVRRRKEKLNSWEEVADWLRTVRIPMTVRSVSGKEYTVSRSCPIPDVSVLELAKSLGPSPALAHELARLTVQERLVVSEATVKKAPSEKPRKRKHPSRHRAKPATPEQCWLVSAFLDLSVERPSAIGRRLQTRILETLLVTGYDSRCLLYTSPSPRDQRGSRMPSSA